MLQLEWASGHRYYSIQSYGTNVIIDSWCLGADWCLILLAEVHPLVARFTFTNHLNLGHTNAHIHIHIHTQPYQHLLRAAPYHLHPHTTPTFRRR
jgi:hypothetical protein